METRDERPRTPADFFNRALESLEKGRIEDAVAFLRSGFFENLYIAPLLLGEKAQTQTIWYPGPHAEPAAASEYVARYRSLWEETPRSLALLSLVWNDPLVRNELKSFINLCKSVGNARGVRQRDDMLRDRARFANPDRIIRTQGEILRRIGQADLELPVERPQLGLVMLSALDPAASSEFFSKLFGIKPIRTRDVAGGYAEFEFEGVHVAIHGYNQHGHGDPYKLGPPPKSLGWGAFFVIRVRDFDRYYKSATNHGIEVIDSDLKHSGARFFVVKDPSGYVFEITEEALRGLQTD